MKGCRPLSRGEIKKIIEKLNIRDKLLCLSGLYFGLRISEILQLKFRDISSEYISIKSKKNSENVTFQIPLNYRLAVKALEGSYKRAGVIVTPDTYLILSREGENRPIHKGHACKLIKKVCKELGIEGKVNTHSFRKSFVTEIYRQTGKDIAETKKYSRHKNLSNLDYYIGTSTNLDLIEKLDW
jgi:integrase